MKRLSWPPGELLIRLPEDAVYSVKATVLMLLTKESQRRMSLSGLCTMMADKISDLVKIYNTRKLRLSAGDLSTGQWLKN
jgi:hypothetical protein